MLKYSKLCAYIGKECAYIEKDCAYIEKKYVRILKIVCIYKHIFTCSSYDVLYNTV